MAFIGAGLTGIGYSLVLPGFGVEVVRRVPAQNRGGALGAFVAFWDLTMGIAAPLSGVVVASEGYSAVYLVGVCGAALGVIVALILKASAAEKSVP
jgi:predicted MFS family arabinose efflux permease